VAGGSPGSKPDRFTGFLVGLSGMSGDRRDFAKIAIYTDSGARQNTEPRMRNRADRPGREMPGSLAGIAAANGRERSSEPVLVTRMNH
jgi:hypothetical protein